MPKTNMEWFYFFLLNYSLHLTELFSLMSRTKQKGSTVWWSLGQPPHPFLLALHSGTYPPRKAGIRAHSRVQLRCRLSAAEMEGDVIGADGGRRPFSFSIASSNCLPPLVRCCCFVRLLASIGSSRTFVISYSVQASHSILLELFF
jgi:hypothetical protein